MLLQTVEAEISADGLVILKERPVLQGQRRRAIVTVLEPLSNAAMGSCETGNVAGVLDLLDSPEFRDSPPGQPEEMEAVIEENRRAWKD
ncbi:MAG: hypothetical protein HQL58_07320 [Magnetococcales bacterium]|nr:hypothetical protein [Magnetococcales bacterium]